MARIYWLSQIGREKGEKRRKGKEKTWTMCRVCFCITLQTFYLTFFTRLAVRNSASSLMKLHHKYVRGIVVACQRECASTNPLYGGKSYISRSIARPPPTTTTHNFQREGWRLTPAHIAQIRSCVTPKRTHTFIFQPVDFPQM